MKYWKTAFIAIALLPFFAEWKAYADLSATLKEGSGKWGYAGHFHTASVSWDGSGFTALLRLKLPLNAKGEALLARESWAGIYILDSKNGHRYIPALASRDFSIATKHLLPLLVAYEKRGNIQWRASARKLSPGNGIFELEATFSNGTLRFRLKPDQGEWLEAGTWKTPGDFHPDTIGISLDAYHKNMVPGEVSFSMFRITGTGKNYDFDFTKENAAYPALKLNSWKGEWLKPVQLETEWLPDRKHHNVFDNGTKPSAGLRIHTTGFIGKTASVNWTLSGVSGEKIATGTNQVPLKGRLTDTSLQLPQLTRNGVYRLSVETGIPSGPQRRREMQFAVIPKRLVPAGTTDADSPYIISNTRNYALFSRIGFRKLRGCFFSYNTIGKTIEDLKPHGMLYIGTMNGRAGGKTPKQLAENAEFQIREILKLKREKPDTFLFSEFYNEPENWAPTNPQTLLWPFAMQSAEIFQGVHAARTNLKMINSGVTHRNLSFLYQLACAAMGKNERMPDIVAVHGYRSPQMPEFAHEDDVAAIRALFGQRPIWNNEDAYFVEGSEGGAEPTITAPSASAIELPEMTQAAYLVRGMLNQLAAGYSAVTHFDGIRNHSMFRDPWHVRPSAVSVATLTGILPNPHFQKRLTETTDNLWVLKWNSAQDTIFSFWTLKKPERITLSGNAEIYDGFGNRVTGNTFICGELPHYVRAKELSFVRDAKNDPVPEHPLESERPPLYGGVTISVKGGTAPDGTPEVKVELCNPGKTTAAGKLSPVFMNNAPSDWSFHPASVDYSIKPGGSKTITFRPQGRKFNPNEPDETAGYSALWWCEGYRIGLHQSANGQQKFLPQRRLLSMRGIPYLENCRIDAEASEWKNVPVFRTRGAKKRNLALAKFWGGSSDYDADFQLAWCRKGLLLFARITDDRHDASETGLNAWRTDSIQLGITGKYGDPDLTDYPVLTLATTGAVLQRDTVNRKAGAVPEVKLSTKRVEPSYGTPGITSYECLIPWELIPGAGTPEAGKTLGFQIVFNESDGYWRKGWVGWFTPMGGHIVDARTFGDVTLTGKALPGLKQYEKEKERKK